jgi:hypothetical protein
VSPPRDDATEHTEASGTPQSADPGEGETRICEHCGSEFEPYRDWQRFCSGGNCRKAYHREKKIRELEDDLKRHVREHVEEAVERAVEEAVEEALETFTY